VLRKISGFKIISLGSEFNKVAENYLIKEIDLTEFEIDLLKSVFIKK
jgi:hypothetical protein